MHNCTYVLTNILFHTAHLSHICFVFNYTCLSFSMFLCQMLFSLCLTYSWINIAAINLFNRIDYYDA